MKSRIKKVVAMLAAGVVAFSCGEARGPLDSNTEADELLPASAFVEAVPAGGIVVFGDRALARAKKSIGGPLHKAYDADVFREKKKEKLKVKFDDYDAGVQIKEAEFEVEKNSIGGTDPIYGDYHLVAMQVETGLTLEDVRVKFYPSGMTFSPSASLTLKVKGDIDEKAFKAYHISGAGEVTTPNVRLKKEKKDSWKLEVEITGFSEYTYDDDEMDQEGDEGL